MVSVLTCWTKQKSPHVVQVVVHGIGEGTLSIGRGIKLLSIFFAQIRINVVKQQREGHASEWLYLCADVTRNMIALWWFGHFNVDSCFSCSWSFAASYLFHFLFQVQAVLLTAESYVQTRWQSVNEVHIVFLRALHQMLELSWKTNQLTLYENYTESEQINSRTFDTISQLFTWFVFSVKLPPLEPVFVIIFRRVQISVQTHSIHSEKKLHKF